MTGCLKALASAALLGLLAYAACGNGKTQVTVDEYVSWCQAGDSTWTVEQHMDHIYSIVAPDVLKDYHEAFVLTAWTIANREEVEKVDDYDESVLAWLLILDAKWKKLPASVREKLEAGGCRVAS